MKSIANPGTGFSLVALTAALMAGTANAACGPDPAASGATVTCSGSDTNGFHATNDTLRVDVSSGATVSSSTKNAIQVLDDSGVLNEGTITNLSGTGIAGGNGNDMYLDFGSGNQGIANLGEINAAIGIAVVTSNVVMNVGDINASDAGIIVEEINNVTNSGNITIGSKGQAIVATAGGNDIRNSGVIISGGDGVVMAAGNSLNNSGKITASGNAVLVTDGPNQFAQQVGIANSGVIIGDIRGSDTNDSVTNVGIIQGDVFLGPGNDQILMAQPSVMVGDIDGGPDGDSISVSGNAAFEGRITNMEGLSIYAESTLIMNLTDDSVIDNSDVAGTLYLDGALTGDMTVGDIGVLSGAATLNGDLINDGVVAPGNSIGTLSVSGSYTQSSTGSLFVKLGSTAADQLVVGGQASLDGGIKTGLQGDDFAGLVGKSYSVLTASAITGTLATTGSLQQGFWTVNVEQTGTVVNVTVTDVTVPIGAMNTSRNVLAGALAAATPVPVEGGIVIEGGTATIPLVSYSSQDATSLSYDSLGDWESAAPTFVSGWNEMGARTPTGAMPKTGSAAFEGTTKGELTETNSPEAFVVEGNVLLTANFASGLVNADFTGMEKIDSHGVSTAWTDFRARMSIADGTSEFAGTAGSDNGVWNGRARGGFYGDEGGMPGYAAGMWSLSSSLGQAIGGFTAKRR